MSCVPHGRKCRAPRCPEGASTVPTAGAFSRISERVPKSGSIRTLAFLPEVRGTLARAVLVFAMALVGCPTSLAAQESRTLLPTDSVPPELDVPRGADSACQAFSLLPREEPVGCAGFRLDDRASLGDSLEDRPTSEPDSSPSWAVKHRYLIASVVAVATVTGNALSSFLDTPHESFHFTNEGFFGEDTYAGGADKASHFVDYSIVSKELAYLYEKIGFSRGDSVLMGFGVAMTAGLINEIGDGINVYGFSWEDLLMDTLGAGSSAVIVAAGLDDLIGFRRGFLLPPAGQKYCCAVEAPGRDYSNEIFTADLHLAGVARRLNWKIGPLRYLLVSVTYGVKGYPSGVPSLRERQVGIEIGLNFQVILNDLGLTRQTWWGYGLHVVQDNGRLPCRWVWFYYALNY